MDSMYIYGRFYCANFYGKVNCQSTVSRFGDRCWLCEHLKTGSRTQGNGPLRPASATLQILYHFDRPGSDSSDDEYPQDHDQDQDQDHHHHHHHHHHHQSQVGFPAGGGHGRPNSPEMNIPHEHRRTNSYADKVENTTASTTMGRGHGRNSNGGRGGVGGSRDVVTRPPRVVSSQSAVRYPTDNDDAWDFSEFKRMLEKNNSRRL